MRRFKNILLVFDPEAANEVALDRAVTLVKKNEAQLTVVKVVDQWPQKAHRFAEVMSVSDIHESVVQGAREQLEKLIASAQQGGTRVGAKVLSGTAFLEIIREVLREKHDLVIMTAEDERGLKTQLFGSTSMHLMRKCPCPIWVMKPTQDKRFARILAAVDTDPEDSDTKHDALNAKIMDLATFLAEQEQSELHIVHAWTMFGESLLRSKRARLKERQVDAWVLEHRQRHERQLDKLLDESALENLKHQVHLTKGSAESVIPVLVHEQQIDLIVMGTICRTGVAGFFIGNTAESALQQVNCSVLTVKPDGFVSPVRPERTSLPTRRLCANSARRRARA
jgi:universal stress protein E